MTRTERATYPRAVNRDRSESRTGLDPSIRKGGAGNHNWGSLANERELEVSAMDDEDLERAAELVMENSSSGSGGSTDTSPKPPIKRNTSDSSGSSINLTVEEREKARKLRKNAFKKGDQLDLAAIARTSAAVSGSPPRDVKTSDHLVPSV